MKAHDVKGEMVPFNRSSGYLFKKALENHKSENYMEAIELFRRAYEIKAEPATLIALAKVLADMGCYEIANRELYNALALDRNCYAAYYGLAVNHYHLKNRQIVLDVTAVYLRHEPKGQYASRAQELWEWALFYGQKAGRGRLDSLKHKADMDVCLKNRALALRRYRRIARSLGHTCAALYQLTNQLIGMKQNKQALAIANKMLKRFPKDAKAICAIVRVQEALGNSDLAGEMLAGLISCDRSADSDTAVYEACISMKAYQAGVDYFSRALSDTPYDVTLLARLGYFHLRTGDGIRAKRFYLKVRTIEPWNQEVLEALRLIESGDDQGVSPPGEPTPHTRFDRMWRMFEVLYGDKTEISPMDKEIIDWALRSCSGRNAQALIKIVLAKAPLEAPLWIRQWLLSPDVSDASKYEAALLMEERKDEQQLMLYKNKMSVSSLKPNRDIAAENRKFFVHGFLFETEDIGRPKEAVVFCVKHYDALPDRVKKKVVGEDSYPYQAALKIMFLRSLDMERNVEEYVNELLISLRRVERAMNDFLKAEGKDDLNETH